MFYLDESVKPGSHLCDKHNTSDISISTRKKEMFLFSCAYAYAYVACVMLIAQVWTRRNSCVIVYVCLLCIKCKVMQYGSLLCWSSVYTRESWKIVWPDNRQSSHMVQVSKLRSGTSKTLHLVPVHLDLSFRFGSPTAQLAHLYHVTGSCKGPPVWRKWS